MVRCRWHVLESADRRQAGRRQDISRCVVRLRPDRRAGVRIRDRSVYGGRIALLPRRTGAGIPARAARGERKSGVEGKSVYVRLSLGCCRSIKNKQNTKNRRKD